MYYYLSLPSHPFTPCLITLSQVMPSRHSHAVGLIDYPLLWGSCPEVAQSWERGRFSAPRRAQVPPGLPFLIFFLSAQTFLVGTEKKEGKEKAGRQPIRIKGKVCDFGGESLTCQETSWSPHNRSPPTPGGHTLSSPGPGHRAPSQSVDSRVLHSFLFLSLVAEPDPHHVLFKVQFLGDGRNLFG